VRWRKYDSDEVDAAAQTPSAHALPGRGKELSNSERLLLTGGFQDAYDFAKRYGNLQVGGGRWSADGAVLNAVSLNYDDSTYGANLSVPMFP